MKRQLQDLIDDIFIDEKSTLENDMDKCHKEIKRWQAQNKEPVNIDVLIINKLNSLEIEENRKKEFI